MAKANNTGLDLPPTPRQVRAIARLCIILNIKEAIEEKVRNRMEARNALYELRAALQGNKNKSKRRVQWWKR